MNERQEEGQDEQQGEEEPRFIVRFIRMPILERLEWPKDEAMWLPLLVVLLCALAGCCGCLLLWLGVIR